MFVLTFSIKWKDANYERSWNSFTILGPMKNDIRFKYKKCMILFYFHCLRSLQSWNWKIMILKTLKYFNILRNVWRHILMCPMKKHPILFHSIVWVHLSHKTEKLWFWKSLKYFNIFWWKNILCQIWICPMEKCLILFYFYYLGSL